MTAVIPLRKPILDRSGGEGRKRKEKLPGEDRERKEQEESGEEGERREEREPREEMENEAEERRGREARRKKNRRDGNEKGGAELRDLENRKKRTEPDKKMGPKRKTKSEKKPELGKITEPGGGKSAPRDQGPVARDAGGTERPVIHVAQIYRSKARGEHSIEQLFAALDPWLARDAGGNCAVQPSGAPGESESEPEPEPESEPAPQKEPRVREDVTQRSRNRPRIEIRRYYLPEPRYHSLPVLYRNLRYVKSVVCRDHPDVYHITGEVYFLGCILPGERTVLTLHDFVYLDRFREGTEVSARDPGKESGEEERIQSETEERAWDRKQTNCWDHRKKRCEKRCGIRSPKRRAQYLLSCWFWHRIPFARCRKIICVSETVQKELWERFPMIPREKTCVIPNTVGEAYETTREQKLESLEALEQRESLESPCWDTDPGARIAVLETKPASEIECDMDKREMSGR